MTEKVIKEFIARLEEASVCFQIHKSDVWSKELEKSRNLLLNAFKEQQKEIEELDESLHIARIGRRDLTNYVKALKETIENAHTELCVGKWDSRENAIDILGKELS